MSGRATYVRTCELLVGENHVHEDIRLAPDDREGNSDCAGGKEEKVQGAPDDHKLARDHLDCFLGSLDAGGQVKCNTHLKVNRKRALQRKKKIRIELKRRK